jgi:hypothetical protein
MEVCLLVFLPGARSILYEKPIFYSGVGYFGFGQKRRS